MYTVHTCIKLAWIMNSVFVYLDGCGNVQNPDISHNTLSVLTFDPTFKYHKRETDMHMYSMYMYMVLALLVARMCVVTCSIMPVMVCVCVGVSVLSLIYNAISLV